MLAETDGDSSETKTKQEIKQKNSGSDASTNVNCADNDISGVRRRFLTVQLDAQLCGTVDIGDHCIHLLIGSLRD